MIVEIAILGLAAIVIFYKYVQLKKRTFDDRNCSHECYRPFLFKIFEKDKSMLDAILEVYEKAKGKT